MSGDNSGQKGDIIVQPSGEDSSNHPAKNRAGKYERESLTDLVDAAISTRV